MVMMDRRTSWVAAAAVLGGGATAIEARQGPDASYGDAVARIIDAATTQGRSWAMLQHLTDRIGPRLSGSAGAAEAVRWTAERLRADGLDARLEPVLVPHWVRGEETAELTGALPRRLVVTALGGSVPTPAEGVTAEVVVADGLEGLRALDPARVKGRIVLFNRAMSAGSAFQGYGRTVDQRTRGASEAARRGAVASIVRSVGTLDARLVHTGAVTYEEGAPRIPAAAITAEDAGLVARLYEAGAAPTIRLRLGCRTLPDAPSHNVVADLRGRERPDEIVLIGAHLDSWDLGTGAHDDGAGVVMVMDALRILKALGLIPRRTIRGVLFMNEENGLRGAKAYASDHAAELARHVAAIESDSGGFSPRGFNANVGAEGLEMLRALSASLAPVGATKISAGGGGADISQMRPARVPLMGLDVERARYFDWHHSPADTLDKVDPGDLARCAAAMAAMAYLLAEMPSTLPRPAPSPSPSPSPTPR
jgi:carboxypeptidase Q